MLTTQQSFKPSNTDRGASEEDRPTVELPCRPLLNHLFHQRPELAHHPLAGE